MGTMIRAMILIVTCALACPTVAFAQTSNGNTRVNDVRRAPPTSVSPKGDFVLRQDLIDPNNPNNLRSDWPRPGGLPGPGH
jgi:hypothetical protein